MSSNMRNVENLSSNHEEANTRIIVHTLDVIRQGYKRVLVKCLHTDVLLLLIIHAGSLDVEVWMVSGTSKNLECHICTAHTIARTFPDMVLANGLSFHAFTGCDSTSSGLRHLRSRTR